MSKHEFGRTFTRGITATVLTAALLSSTAMAQSVDVSKWSPEYVRSHRGHRRPSTRQATATRSRRLDYKGTLTFWYHRCRSRATPIYCTRTIDEISSQTFRETYPNIELDEQGIDLQRTDRQAAHATAGSAAPDMVRMQILGGVEFAAKGYLQEIKLEDFGYPTADFWPGALKSVTWDGKYYGIPTNNETMAFIWNKQIFADAGLDPENPPATWDDVVAYSNQIKQETGKNGYGMVCKVNAGNTPFRFMPVVWAYGASALDEAMDEPTYATTMINTPEGIAALQTFYDMYVRDQSVPTSALTNTQTENQDLFLAGEIAMMISHPSEYVAAHGPCRQGDWRRQGEVPIRSSPTCPTV